MGIKPQKPITSLGSYIDEILLKRKSFEKDDIIWFRGEASTEYSLVPNIYRKFREKPVYIQDLKQPKKFSVLEENIDTSFYRKSFLYLSKNSIENTSWNRYLLKQHYGMKTRLLDWTESALIALFFALEKNTVEPNDVRIWVLSPFSLNNYSVGKLHNSHNTFRKIVTLSDFDIKQNLINERGELRLDELGRKYYRLDCEDESLYPLAIYPPYLDQRMMAQQSCFTLFGNIVKGLNVNDSAKKFLDWIDIDNKSKRKIFNDLKDLGISYHSVFPDLDGLGKDINQHHAYDISRSQENSDLDAFLTEID